MLDMDDDGYVILPWRGSLDLNSSKKMIQEYVTAIYCELLQSFSWLAFQILIAGLYRLVHQ